MVTGGRVETGAPEGCSEPEGRIALKGENSGKPFWGCSTYPKCKAIVSLAQA